jgi:hypothetical protein
MKPHDRGAPTLGGTFVTVHPSVAFAAFAAGLVVGGGAYAASHDLGLGDGLAASADARARLGQDMAVGRHGRRLRLVAWHAPRVPHLKPPRPQAPVLQVVSAPAVSPAPVTSTSPAPPVTRTSPTGGDDGGEDD